MPDKDRGSTSPVLPMELEFLQQIMGGSAEEFGAAIAKAILNTPFVAYEPEEIKRIRVSLGKTNEEFSDIFKLSLDEIKAWQTPRISSKTGKPSQKHRDPQPPACILLFWCAVVVNTNPACRNNQIRLAARYGPDWVQKS